jgi:LacI family transcriptional regulator
MNYLLEQGHKNIAFITYGIISNYNNIHRRDAFIQFSKNNALNGNTHYVHINSNDNFIEIIAKVLKKNVTAIISSGEDVGIYTAYVLDLLGKKIPDDLSFISYEYIDVSCYFSPPHTTLEQDFQSLSKLSMDLCENLSDGNMSNVGNKIVPYKFNIRDSVSRVGIPKIQTR